ncbi:MAG TPA: hypothetical protein VEB22_15410 [Phycisphaerales bacterium]|nr:hypothetical protein [Phycisphaerales bacterium]
MSLDWTRPGGHVPWDLGRLITSDELDRMGTMAEQSLQFLLALLFYDVNNSKPLSGFPADTDYGKVVATGDLAAEITAGWGMLYDSTKVAPSGDNFEYQSYQPMVIDADEAITLSAHHATLPRWDIVVIRPERENTDTTTRRVKDPTTGNESNQSVPLRRRWGFVAQVVAGTAASSPVEPAVPAGTLKIARAEVPATSGAAVWRDTRPLVELGSMLKGHPAEEYARNYIPDPSAKPNALKVSASSPTSMVLVVEEGCAVIRGISRWYPRQTVTISTADPTNPRIDLVVAKEDGTVAVVVGTPAGSPVAPAAPAQSISLCQVSVAAADTTIAAGDLTDLRVSGFRNSDVAKGARRPVGNEQVEEYALNHKVLSVPEVFISLGAATFPTSQFTAELPIELFLPDQTTEYEGPFGEHSCAFEVNVRFLRNDGALGAGYVGATADFTTPSRKTFIATEHFTAGFPVNLTGMAVYFKPASGNAADVNEESSPSTGEHHVFWMNARTGTLKLDLLNTIAVGTYEFLVTVRPIGRPGGFRRRKVTFTIV